MPPTATPQAEKRTRTRSPSVRISERASGQLDQLADKAARAFQEANGFPLKPNHTQLVESLVEGAMSSENGNG